MDASFHNGKVNMLTVLSEILCFCDLELNFSGHRDRAPKPHKTRTVGRKSERMGLILIFYTRPTLLLNLRVLGLWVIKTSVRFRHSLLCKYVTFLKRFHAQIHTQARCRLRNTSGDNRGTSCGQRAYVTTRTDFTRIIFRLLKL
jgi:hypothetical protein